MRFAALLFVPLAACRAPDGETSPIRSHVALFRVDASALHREDLVEADAVTAAFLEQCMDGRLPTRLRDAIDAECGRGATLLLAKSFANNLDYAWDQEPTPALAIVTKIKPRGARPEGRIGGALVGTAGWLLIGIPGYFIDDYDHYPPIELEISMYEGLARSDRPLGAFEVGGEPVSTNFIDRNGVAVLPYVMTILIPPHLVSAMEQDDPDTMAELLLDSIAKTAARAIATRVRSWELLTPDERKRK